MKMCKPSRNWRAEMLKDNGMTGNQMRILEESEANIAAQEAEETAEADIENLTKTPAQVNEGLILDMVKAVKGGFVELGGLLVENYEKGYWSSYESFKTFIGTLAIGSYSQVNRMMGIARMVAASQLTREDAIEMGPSKAALLLALAKKGTLTPELIAQALNGPWSDLRDTIKGDRLLSKVEAHITCPRCGNQFVFHKEMVIKEG